MKYIPDIFSSQVEDSESLNLLFPLHVVIMNFGMTVLYTFDLTV